MTGFGRAESSGIVVEARTLNSKQLDLSIKMPSRFRILEYDLRAVASRAIVRGKADVYVTFDAGSSVGATINAPVFEAYYRQIADAARAVGGSTEGIAAAILRLPDVVGGENTAASQEELDVLRECFERALGALELFRAHEGEILAADILARVDRIEELLGQVEPHEKARLGVVRQRILDHVAALGVVVDANRLEQEMVFWVEKLDITEEKVRLAKHCDYFRETCATPELDVGRKLGFISQEMGREINTLGSKANDAEIQRIVVQMKDELEKIKEQLLNIL